METKQTPRKLEHLDLRPDRDELNMLYSPCGMSAYFDLLNSAYTGDLDRFKKVASCCDKRGEGLSITVQRLVDGDGRGSLAFAAAGGRVDVCRYLLEELNLDIDVKDNHGVTPLSYGAVKGQLNTVEYLLEKGANPDGSNDPNSTANTPLHYAVLGGDRKIQTLLLSNGIRINVATRSGTALSYAAVLGQVDAVKVLLDHHADPNVEMLGVVTPVNSTIINNSLQIMDLLLQAGADPNAKSCGFAPLILAVNYGLTQFVVRLLEAGADPNVTDIKGMTAVENAAKEGSNEIVEILFPVTSRIPTYPNWTIAGLMEHVHSEATKKKKKKKPEAYETFLHGKRKGAEAFHKKQYFLAATWYSEALEVAPADATLLSNRSACYACMRDGNEALRDATECISLRPDWPKAYYRAGVALNILKRYREAADVFFKGLTLDPANKELVDAFRDANEARLKSIILRP
ncbi:ankyrin-2-like isoform X1 [Papaver somniferum]|uniref:ankyrin-2-like isoform X1 n=1 Tax=Papaver somniferum TaxID=3469 RepID=UPI000E705370|nr:ankyrin-2-like isoform X1 [Papaver somniferum]